MGLKRIHSGGIECKIEPDTSTRWVISVKYSGQSPASTLSVQESTMDEAKKFADDSVLKSGHICNRFCKNWEQF
jgi:hypothetical protein